MSVNDAQKSQKYHHHTYECNSHYPIIAAIDLGTSSCRLLIAKVNVAGVRTNYFRSKPKPMSWKIIDSFAKVVRLGEGLYTNDALAPEAIDRAMEALAICRTKLDRYQLHGIRAVATEACRRASNKEVLVKRAHDELGFKIEVIDAAEEAFLALKGCSAMLNPDVPYGIVFDIGGGSTEVILVNIKKEGKRRLGYPVSFDIIDSISIPYGVVTTTEAFDMADGDSKVLVCLQQKIFEMLSKFVDKNNILQFIKNNDLQITGSSGTVTTLAAYHLGLTQYERRLVDGITLSYVELSNAMNKIISMTQEGKLDNNIFGLGRVDYVITGSVILKAICNAIPALEMRIADRGVREGILIDLMVETIRI